MSYNTGINQRVKDQEFFTNTTAMDESLTQTNLSLIANLRYVQTYVSSIINNYLTILNPNFQGTLTSSTGGNITLTGNSYLSVPTIANLTNFTQTPTINNNPVSLVKIGEIKMFISSSSVPNNYLKCDGASYSISQYPSLFNIINYTYGGGGSNFNVPNFTSAFAIGGNSQNSLGCSLSNFATGNGQSGGANNYLTSCFFGATPSSSAPVITTVPPHTHNVQDLGHFHFTGFFNEVTSAAYVPDTPQLPYFNENAYNVETFLSTTNISVENVGQNIQATDETSGLSGVNVSPPYVAVWYYICSN